MVISHKEDNVFGRLKNVHNVHTSPTIYQDDMLNLGIRMEIKIMSTSKSRFKINSEHISMINVSKTPVYLPLIFCPLSVIAKAKKAPPYIYNKIGAYRPPWLLIVK